MVFLPTCYFMSTPSQPSPPPLGMWSATALVIASMVGAGVFTSAGFALAALESRGWVVATWIIGGVVALSGAVAYGALAARVRESGGEYVLLARQVHPFAGFLAGWISLVAGFAVPTATAAVLLEIYVWPLVSSLPLERPGSVSVAAIALASLLHCAGVRPGVWLQTTIVACKVVGLLAMVGIGAWLLATGPGFEDDLPAVSKVNPFVVANALTWVALAYAGFNASIYVVEEVRDSERNVPRSMVVGTAIVVVLYIALNAIFVYSGPFDRLSGQQDIAAVAARMLGGPAMEFATRVLICSALATSVSAMTIMGPRVYAKMASDRLFPLPIPAYQPGRAPWVAILLQAVLASVVVLSVGLKDQLTYLGFTLSLCSAAAVATLFWPSQSHRPSGLQLAAAGMFVAATLLYTTLTALRAPLPSAVAAGITVLSALVCYVLLTRLRPTAGLQN